jgi:hypothetical protein
VVTRKNAVFWDVTPCGSCKNRRFGGRYRLHHEGDNVVPSSLILVTLMTEAISSSETSVLTRVTRRNIPEDTILYTSYLVKHESREGAVDIASGYAVRVRVPEE